MIVETTYTNPEQDQIINDLIGKPFGFMQRLRMNGIGSKRMIIKDVSPNMKTLMNDISDLNYANIELRPGGILIRINKGLRTFSWVIPYYHLVIYKTNGASIHAQGKYIQFKENRTFKENKTFFNKMLDKKIEFDAQFSFY
ncbi:MAG: hypothetical protein HKN00_05070 [Flavobacteriaceae bacterium]|nr:hypothetical protein [Bacteroidia bacterium]MBT8287915.1 hypothetical protein [Bacteroidia bacterium]NNF74533.1 hypothetical protein [Flavobacteriaceae bacterium]